MKRYHSKEFLLKEIEKGKNYLQIAKENDIDLSTIQRWLRKHSLTKKRVSWSKEETSLLETHYGLNQNIYGLFPNKSISSINHKASRLKLKREDRIRKYSINHDFFKKWTPEMAYILGFFFSDGDVSSDKKYLRIHLHKKDDYILEKIAETMGSNRPIGKYVDSSTLRLDSKILVEDLMGLGCVPKKSLVLKFPKVPDRVLSDFIRGYFDGDGSIHFNKPNTIKISIVGTKEFLSELQTQLKRILGLKTRNLYNS